MDEFTIVMNLETGEEMGFLLPPGEAVQAAWRYGRRRRCLREVEPPGLTRGGAGTILMNL